MLMADNAVDAPESIPLELVPLLSVYGRNRRVSLRVERLPERARLSRGRNNGDRSWSLLREDLDDLRYLLPPGMKAHTLAIRIINQDTEDGSTLAVLDFPVTPPRVSEPGQVTHQVAAPELRRLQDENTQLKTTLASRAQELAETRQAVEQSLAREMTARAELDGARAGFESELARRLAHERAEAASHESKARLDWQARQNERFDEARTKWQAEAEAALTKAKEAWKAEEAARLIRAETQWREQSAHALGEALSRAKQADAAIARAEADAARMSSDGVELRRLRGELAESSAALNARARELAETRHALEQARADTSRTKAELASARVAWQAELERRLASERAELAARSPGVESGESLAVESLLQSRVDEVRTQCQQEFVAAIARAKETWIAEESARQARAEEQWREKSGRALAESAAKLERAETALARAQAAALQDTADTVELRRVREELNAARVSLSDRENRLSQAKLEMQRARERWKVESEIALKKAQEAWKAEEAYRISVLRGDWQKDLRVQRERDTAEEDDNRQPAFNLLRDGLLAAGLAVVVVLFYPTIAPIAEQWLPPGVLPSYGTSASAQIPAPPPVHTGVATPVVSRSQAVVNVRAANLRTDPSGTADVVATLSRGTEVTLLEKRGSWQRIQFARGTETRDGWIFAASLGQPSAVTK